MKLSKSIFAVAFALATTGLVGCTPSGPENEQPQAPKPYVGESVNVKGYDRSILEFTPKSDPGKTCVAIAGQESGGVTCFPTDPNASKLPALKVLYSYETQVSGYDRSILEFVPKSDAGKICVAISGQESSGITCFNQGQGPAAEKPAP